MGLIIIFKVLIVDDDTLVRIGIKSSIKWEEMGLELIGEASDGDEALSLIERENPHIILLDIKMPRVSGIEVLKVINEKQIKTNVIILSCYNDYEYVREALKLGAVDYILKLSLKPEELTNLLLHISNSLFNSSSSEIISEKDTILQEYVIGKLKGKDKEESSFNNSQINDFNSCINANTNIVCVLSIRQEQEKQQHIIKNITCEVLKDSDNSYYIFQEEYMEIIIIYTNIYNISVIHENIERIYSVLKSYIEINLFIGVSNEFSGLECMQRAYDQCIHSIKYSFYIPNKTIIFFKDTKTFCMGNYILTKNIIEELRFFVEVMKYNKFKEKINRLFDEIISEKKVYPNIVKECLIEIISLLSNYLKWYNKSFADMNIISPYAQVVNIDNVYHLQGWFEKLTDHYINYIKRVIDFNKVRDEIKESVKYIQENYNKKINLSIISSYVNQSENYFSYIFKKEMGKCFVEYLNSYRIEKAKELLLHKNYKIYEVCEMVGYNTMSHFINLFKKYTGFTPMEFKHKYMPVIY
jgi:two-component system response regulator YesN